MTILELFKTKTAEEIADEYVKEYRRCGSPNKIPLAFFFDGFSEVCDCPEDCEYYCEYDDYYGCDACYLDDGEECPYHINKDEALKREFIEWLNTEIPEVNK